jgi:NADPH-dependent curcumin reductase CurA
LKFDHAFNYKKISLNDALKKAAPNGVDVFFDNVSLIMNMTFFIIEDFNRLVGNFFMK